MMNSTAYAPLLHRRAPAALVATLTAAGAIVMAAPVLGQSEPPASCFTDQPGTVGSVDHPTDPDAVVLRMAVGGGFVPFEISFLEENPVFTLYGNDVAVWRPAAPPDAEFSDAWPAYLCARLTPEQVDELLTYALEDGRLADARDTYLNPNIVDVPTTTFTIDAAGVDKAVAVHALGFEMAPEEDADARAGFQGLADRLTSFEIDGAVPFEPLAYAALLTARVPDPEAEAEPLAWPWPDMTLDAFQGDEFTRTGTLTPEQVGVVTAVPNGGQVGIAITGPDGTPWSLTVRPFLPDTVTTS